MRLPPCADFCRCLTILSTRRGVIAAVALGASLTLCAQTAPAVPPARLTIDPAQIVTPVSPMLYGMMTEEINHAFDGGLYAEQVQNRTFRGSWQGIEHWTLVRQGDSRASMQVDKSTGPSTALPYSVKLVVDSASRDSEAGLSNSGYWGIAVNPHTVYRGSFYARFDDAAAGPITARLISDSSGAVLAEATVATHAGGWSKYEYTLNTAASVVPASNNHLQLTVAHPGTFWLQLVSLMPPTFNHRPNGNRIDLMERMAALHPHFLRLPGGNYLEGDRLSDWYNFKETIGPLVDRPGHQAPWGYWSSDGLGLLEFAEWCEDLKIEPVLAVYAGYSLQGQHVAPGKDLEPYVQAALDEVEYLTGDVTTRWGSERAKAGHPAPFALRYIEIGNEDNFDKSGSYDERFAQFARAFRKQLPQYKLIATTPVKVAADEQPDILDDHYYKPASEMLDFVHHYDNAPRTGPKIFVGEWATLSGTPTPDFGGALADAAWMTSLERNSDLIIMAAYAPLLVNVNPQASQWGTNLIGYDAPTSYASPSYYAQALFAGHLGDGTPKSTLSGAGERFFYSATVGTADDVLHLKLVNASNLDQPLEIELQGLTGSKTASLLSLHGASYEATNSLAVPDLIHPVGSTARVTGATWKHTVPALTIEVVDLPLR